MISGMQTGQEAMSKSMLSLTLSGLRFWQSQFMDDCTSLWGPWWIGGLERGCLIDISLLECCAVAVSLRGNKGKVPLRCSSSCSGTKILLDLKS